MGGYALLLAFEACGLVTSDALLRRRSGVIRAWFGVCLGLMLMMWTPVPFAFAIRFTRAAQLLGLGVSALLAAGAFFSARKLPRAKERFTGDLSPVLLLCLIVPVILLGGYLMHTHYIRAAADGSLHSGQSTYGDSPLHLGIATSLMNASFPPDYSILKGTTLGYPFLADSMVTSMLLFGADLSGSFAVTGTIMLACVFTGFTLFAWELTRRKLAVVLAFVLLLFNGGFGFAYIFDGVMTDPTALQEVFTGFYKTPTNMTDLNVRWVNLLCDMFIPQRTFLAGWTVLLPALMLLVTAKERGDFILLGVWAGLMPMVHTHSFLALGLISAGCLMCALRDREKLVNYLIYAAIACALALPQLLTWSFPQTVGGGSLRLYFNWANNNGSGKLTDLKEEYFWFWIKNVGPVYLLMLPAALSMPKGSRRRALSLGALLVYIVAETVMFQPNTYDNNKLFYAAFMVMLPAVASLLADLWDRLKGIRGRWVFAVCLIFVCTVSGALTIAREVVSDYTLFGANEVAAADWIKENTAEKSMFLTTDNHNNAVAALTGRYIVCGTGSYLYYHGLDYSQQRYDELAMFEQPGENEALFTQYGVDYVYLSSHERTDYLVDTDWFEANGLLVYENSEVKIYALSEEAKAAAEGQ